VNSQTVTQLYPPPQREVALKGLYLQPFAAQCGLHSQVFANFIASLDGRIAIEQPISGERGIPRSIANPRDWRLYQELAAGAHVLLVSARFIRQLALGIAQDSLPVSSDPAFADLLQWREQQGLLPQPAVVIVSASLNLPMAGLCANLDRPVFVATGEQADPAAVESIKQQGATVLFAGEGRRVEGERLIAQLRARGFHRIYSIAGPVVLETLLQARVLDCIYLTHVHRLIGGSSYDTLLKGELLQPPADFKLQALFYDHRGGENCGQLFGIYHVSD
jgi:riboflavin biosynthesis pyrimidine reductase